MKETIAIEIGVFSNKLQSHDEQSYIMPVASKIYIYQLDLKNLIYMMVKIDNHHQVYVSQFIVVRSRIRSIISHLRAKLTRYDYTKIPSSIFYLYGSTGDAICFFENSQRKIRVKTPFLQSYVH